MNASIGATGTYEGDWAFLQSGKDCFNLLLHCASVGLALPAMKMSAQVLNYQGNSLRVLSARS
jgi:hypothetical protein